MLEIKKLICRFGKTVSFGNPSLRDFANAMVVLIGANPTGSWSEPKEAAIRIRTSLHTLVKE